MNEKTGKVVGRSKEEIVSIVDALNIQVDNPVSVLTQETSKTLLAKGDGKALYKFFLKATQLEQIQNDHVVVAEQLDTIAKLLEEREKGMASMVQEVVRAEDRYKVRR